MKNFIYLPILAVLILCGCKSNSFMTQRYTHFDHNPSKGEHRIVKQEKPATPVFVASADQHTLYISEVFDQYTKPAEELAGHKTQAKEETMLASASVRSSTGFQALKAGNPLKAMKLTTQRVIKAGAKQQAKAAKHGLIFGLINLALFIVLCVILVAGIIFLITLIAV